MTLAAGSMTAASSRLREHLPAPHWHVAGLPPGVPYHEQQFRALMTETKGVLALTAEEQADLADRLRSALDGAL